MCNINERIKILRKKIGMNQNEFGNKIGVAQTYLSQIEGGTRDVTDKILRIILLEKWDGKIINEEWLRNGTGEMFTSLSKDEQLAEFFADVQLAGESDFRNRFVSALAELDPEDWKLVEKIVLKLSNKPRE